jgi:hypothetical protein
VFIHPSTLGAIRRYKDLNNRYEEVVPQCHHGSAYGVQRRFIGAECGGQRATHLVDAVETIRTRGAVQQKVALGVVQRAGQMGLLHE